MNSYKIINICLAGVLGFIFLYSGFFYSDKSGVKCVVKQRTGHECLSCGFSRDFYAYTTLKQNHEPINDLSFGVYLFFLITLIARVPVFIFSPKDVISKKYYYWVGVDVFFNVAGFLFVFWELIVNL